MIELDQNGKAVTTSIDPQSPEDIVNRMHALIGMLQRAEGHDDIQYPYDNYLVLQMLREQLPTHEQAEEYLKVHSKKV